MSESCCRICHGRRTWCNQIQFISPCACKGSIQYVHSTCLNLWRRAEYKNWSKCSTCKERYHIDSRTTKYVNLNLLNGLLVLCKYSVEILCLYLFVVFYDVYGSEYLDEYITLLGVGLLKVCCHFIRRGFNKVSKFLLNRNITVYLQMITYHRWNYDDFICKLGYMYGANIFKFDLMFIRYKYNINKRSMIKNQPQENVIVGNPGEENMDMIPMNEEPINWVADPAPVGWDQN